VLDFIWGRVDAAAARLATANRVHPDALLLFLQAITQVAASVQNQKKDHTAAVRLAIEARDLAYRAADAPTILPRSSYRYQARLTGLMIDNALAHEPSVRDPLRPARMRDQCERAAVEGRSLPIARRKYLPGGVAKGHDLECARFLVAAWLRDAPDAADALRLGARLDLRAGSWLSALGYADRVLRKHPADQEMKKLREEAIAGLRKQLNMMPSLPTP
jgi:hypothetical protein